MKVKVNKDTKKPEKFTWAKHKKWGIEYVKPFIRVQAMTPQEI